MAQAYETFRFSAIDYPPQSKQPLHSLATPRIGSSVAKGIAIVSEDG